MPRISATGSRQRIQPSRSHVRIVGAHGPRCDARAMSASPSGWLMQTTGVRGLRPIDSGVGAPQIDVQMPS